MERYGRYQTVSDFSEALRREGIRIPMSADLSSLGRPLDVAGKRAPNRIAIQPMEGCDCTESGTPTELTLRRYLRFAEGGAGLLWFEANAVCPEGRANPKQMMLTAANMDDFKRLLERVRESAVRANGFAPLTVLQATHSGRYSRPGRKPAPLIAYRCRTLEKQGLDEHAHLMSDDELSALPEMYHNTARLAREAGFDALDVKACHRYLLSELLSAYEREGDYGGRYENRVRLLKDCVRAALAASADMLIAARLNIYDGYAWPDGWGVGERGDETPDLTEPIRLVRELYALGVPLVNLTLGNPYFNPHVNRPYARGAYVPPESPLRGVERACRLIGDVKRAVPEIKVVASALSYMRAFAGNVGAGMVEAGETDMVGYGRMAFAYPDFANALLHRGALESKKVCVACGKCTELMRMGQTTGCVVRDALYTRLYQEAKAL